MAAYLIRSDCEGSNIVDGDVRSVRKMKAMTVKMERVTLIGTGRYNLTNFVY
jgi:hypothetical protein